MHFVFLKQFSDLNKVSSSSILVYRKRRTHGQYKCISLPECSLHITIYLSYACRLTHMFWVNK